MKNIFIPICIMMCSIYNIYVPIRTPMICLMILQNIVYSLYVVSNRLSSGENPLSQTTTKPIPVPTVFLFDAEGSDNGAHVSNRGDMWGGRPS